VWLRAEQVLQRKGRGIIYLGMAVYGQVRHITADRNACDRYVPCSIVTKETVIDGGLEKKNKKKEPKR